MCSLLRTGCVCVCVLLFFFFFFVYFFFFNDTATTEIYTLSLHDALPISISPTTISKEMGFSVRYLHWLFRKEDETVSQYIMRKRIEFAQTLLNSSANTFFSITDVAFICGFNDSTHFSRRFKQQVGLSPSKYRNV